MVCKTWSHRQRTSIVIRSPESHTKNCQTGTCVQKECLSGPARSEEASSRKSDLSKMGYFKILETSEASTLKWDQNNLTDFSENQIGRFSESI